MAEKQVLTHLKAVGLSELRGWAFERLAADPGAPTAGQIWENTTDKTIKFYDGTVTKVLVDTTVVSSETVAGLIELATQAEATAGTDTTKAITPATLAGVISGISIPKTYGVDLNSLEADVTRVFAGGQTTYTVAHAQNITVTVSEVKEISTGDVVIADLKEVDANTFEVSFNGNSTDNTFKLSLVGA